MSIDIRILREKLEINKFNRDQIDLSTKSFDTFENSSFEKQFVVEDSMAMRPDLLALDITNSMDFTEILKQNYISNPFTLDANDTILLRTSGSNKIITPKSTMQDSDQDIRSKYVNPNKAASPDTKIQKLANKFKKLQELGADTPAPSPSNLPPNFNEFGNGEVEVINNKVRFAPGVARNNSECSTEPISKAELISKVLRNKLNNPQ
jgi:hypothetical protein